MPTVRQASSDESKPPGENISSGGPEPATSYLVAMPPISTDDTYPSLDLASRSDVPRIGGDRVERDLRDVGVRVGRVVDR